MVNAFSVRRLEPAELRPTFDCADDDLNDFYANDSIQSGKELLSVTYVAEQDGKVISFFSVSNDSLKKEQLSRSKFERIVKPIPRPKRYSSMPAVKIGRFATCRNMQCSGIGTEILDFVKFWFTTGNKTGCRFIIVDAYNKTRAISFYQKNGFDFLLQSDKKEETRLMYFDLITFKP